MKGKKQINPENKKCCNHHSNQAEDQSTPLIPNGKNYTVFKIQGMDCAEEVAALKKELSPFVGGQENLLFNILERKLIIKKSVSSIDQKFLVNSIRKLGMKAILEGSLEQPPSFYQKNERLIFTGLSALTIVMGFILHWVLHGELKHAFLAGDDILKHQFPAASVALYSLAIILGGRFVFPKALSSLKKLRPDMNLLMTIAVIGAVFIGEWLEAATVAFLFSFSLLLESWSVEKARNAVKALLDLAPNDVRIINSIGEEEIIFANTVSVGTIFVVKPGERLPLDGTVVKGNSEINQAPVTGESLPVYKKEGDLVFSGTINGNGALEIRCDKTSDHSMISNIIRLVNEAHMQRAPSEQWVENFAKIYTPLVMGLALLVLIIPPLLFSGVWADYLYRSLVLLVIACPCALVISTPVSIVAALASAARNGILIKSGRSVELPAHLHAIAFDKTGTITNGKLAVAKIIPFNHHSDQDLLKIAAAIESRSEHPIAKAIILFAKSKGLTIAPVENYQAIPGKGATAVVEGSNHWVGSHRYLEEKGQEDREVHERLRVLTESGHSVVVIGNDNHVCGFIALTDSIRPEVKETIQKLHHLGIKHFVMLTGDNKGTAQLLSEKAGIDHFYSELLPQDKVNKIEELIQSMGKVAMIGDGINDAPAMARSSLGIVMGVAGSDAAIESADVALMSDDLRKIPWLISHSKRTLSIIKQNIIFSLSVKFLFVVLTFTGHSTLWGAISADMGASLLVIFNGLRLLR